MKTLILFVLVLMITLGFSNADATILENKSLVGSDIKNETFLTLKFSEDFIIHKKITPQIESGELEIYSEKIDLKNADVHYMANGNAIVIKSLNTDLNVIMYARTTSSNSDYLINTYLLTDNLFHKVQIKANIIDGSLMALNSPVSPENPEIHFITSHYEKVYNNSEFKFSVKVFDKSIYSGNNFDNFKGKLNGVKVSATIIDPNGKIKKPNKNPE